MSDYYILITEEPVDMDYGVKFKYSGNGSEAEFTIVDESAYTALVEQFDIFSNDFERAVNYNIDNILKNKVIGKAEKSSQIVENIDDNNSRSLTFQDLFAVVQDYIGEDRFESLNGVVSNINTTLSNISGRISNIENTRATIQQLSTLETNLRSSLGNYYTSSKINELLKSKANSSHSHSGGWKVVDVLGGWTTEDCYLLVNEDLHFCNYHINTFFSNGTANKKYEWGSGTIGNIPSKYRPPGARFGAIRTSNNGHGTMWVASDGKIGAVFSTTWKDKFVYVYGDVWWRYK